MSKNKKKVKIQLAKEIFLYSLNTMKKILEVGEFKFGKKSDEYKYYKQEVMKYTYKGLKNLFSLLEKSNIIQKCSCNCNLKHGYQDCELCRGAGYRNFEDET